MPILERGKPQPTAVECIREVRAGVPRERLDDVLHFYAEILGMPIWPARWQIPGGAGLGSPIAGLYLQFRHDPEIDPVRRRFTLVADSLDTLEKRLQELEWRYRRYRGFGWSDQYILLRDPAGHLVEVRQSRTM
jgi:hypothetical protein